MLSFSDMRNPRTCAYASNAASSNEDHSALAPGPVREERSANSENAAIAVGANGRIIKRAIRNSVNGYTFTGKAPVESVGYEIISQC